MVLVGLVHHLDLLLRRHGGHGSVAPQMVKGGLGVLLAHNLVAACHCMGVVARG